MASKTTDRAPTPRTTVRRGARRAEYSPREIRSILESAWLCHLGFSHEGSPFVIPTCYGLVGDDLVVHGAAASRTMKALGGKLQACVTVTLVDGIVLARSAFHHSVNYRSVMIFGSLQAIEDESEGRRALNALVDQVLPGRSRECRSANAKELRATTILKMPLAEASAKVRQGPPGDDAEDLQLPHWAGVLPLGQVATGLPQPSPDLRTDQPFSPAVQAWHAQSLASRD